MKKVVKEYRTIRLGETGNSGDTIAKASNEIDEAIIHNNERLLEMDISDRIAYCLENHECLTFHTEISGRKGKFVFDMMLPDGCNLLGWSQNGYRIEDSYDARYDLSMRGNVKKMGNES